MSVGGRYGKAGQATQQRAAHIRCVVESQLGMHQPAQQPPAQRSVPGARTSRIVSSCEALYCAITLFSVSWMMEGSTRSAGGSWQQCKWGSDHPG